MGSVATSSPFPYGLHNAADAYASSMRTAMSAYVELPGHHLCSTHDLLVSTPASTHADFAEDSDSWAGVDLSELRDPEALCRFLDASDYCFVYFDPDEDGYELSWP
jgi:hypothetical protein